MRDDSMNAALLETLEPRTLLSVDPVLVADLVAGAGGSNPSQFVEVNGTLFFSADDGVNGVELWQSDGTSAGTTLVKDIINGSTGSSPRALTNVNGTLFFSANDGANGYELWQSDGTSTGTTLIKDINSGISSSYPVLLTNVNGTLFFIAIDDVNGRELWQSDGTSAGTKLVKDIRNGSSGSLPRYLTNVNGTLFFQANDGTHGYELWQSDGTSTGTTLIKDINSGISSSYPSFLTNVNGTLFFRAFDHTSGYELWKSNGTSNGTMLVKDIRNGSGSSYPGSLTNVNGTLFFRANDGTHGYELWQSDGTSVGTTLVKDTRAGSGSSYPSFLTNVNGTLFFAADDGLNGFELWESDGTSVGTTLVKDIHSGNSSSSPYHLTNVNGTLFFTADDGTNGSELWQSDGTSVGTTLVKDIHSGNSSSSPYHLTNVNGTLFFRANDGTNGYELWSMPVNSRPQLTVFSAALDTTLEDTEVELTFAEFLAQGDQSDADGTVDAFIVQAVTSGTLKIGTSAASATAFAVGSNDKIDALNIAYWTPAANISGNAIAVLTVLAQDNIGDNSNLPVTASVDVTAVADTPSVTNAATAEDVQTTSGLVISRNAADGPEVTHFKITNITGGVLFLNDGTTAISNGDFITVAQANAGLKFTPSLNSVVTGHFTVQASLSSVDGGRGGSTITADIIVSAVADTPSVTHAATLANTQTKSGLVISRNAADGVEVTHFKITNITGGSLFQNDGMTPISDNEFITFAQGDAGLKFTPAQNSLVTGHFSVQASISNGDAGLGGETVVANINISPAPIGTSGNDAFVLTYSGSAPSGTVSVTIAANGGTSVVLGTFPMNAPLTIDGVGGTDSVRVVGTTGDDTITVGSSTALTVNGASLILTSIETRTLAGDAGNDVYRFDADAALGLWTLDESGGGTDTIDFALTTTVGLSLNLGIASTQVVHPTNLSLNLNASDTFENISGGAQNDTLVGNALANLLRGNAGNDALNGAAGDDSLLGGSGDDTYIFATASAAEADTLTEGVNGGVDTISFASITTPVTFSLATGAVQSVHTNRTIRLNSTIQFENVAGGSGNDRLTGNSVANLLRGNAGNDTLNGAAGDDSLLGGVGDDTYIFATAATAEADTLTEGVNGGVDTISFASITTPVTFSLATGAVQSVHTNRTVRLNSTIQFENVAGGSGNDRLAGNSVANLLRGNAGNDTLNGAAGDDSLLGGSGDDTYIFATAAAAEADALTEGVNGGVDTISFASITTPVTFSLATGAVQSVHTNRTIRLNSTIQFENVAGGSGNDRLTGNTVANILIGNAGNDTLNGLGGRDILVGGLGLDTLNGGEDEDILITGRTTSDALFSNLNRMRVEWTSGNSYATRINNLRVGVGSPAVSLKAKVNVLNDAGEDDSLNGGNGTDWYFRALDDVITGLVAGEILDVL